MRAKKRDGAQTRSKKAKILAGEQGKGKETVERDRMKRRETE
jgi:hypothetical protein